MRFRPMLVGEVARAAKIPRETLRVWLRRDFPFVEPTKGGWKRFTDFETIIIIAFSAIVRATQDHDLAQLGSLLCGKALMDEWIEDENGTPYFSQETFSKDRFLYFWRDEYGKWKAEMADAPDGATEVTNRLISDSYNVAPVFTVVNIGAILRQSLLAILKVQVEADGSTDEVSE